MSFFPSLGFLPLIDGAIQEGRGVAASVLGQTYDVRRINSSTNGSISSNAALYTSFPARIRRTSKKVAIENTIFDLVCFEATCDNRVLEIGDEMTETGYEAMANGVYVMAQARPTRETLWMRCESNVAITRMMPAAGQEAQQPTFGWSAAQSGAYGGVDKRTEAVLTLTNGTYAFSTQPGATPAGVVCGLQPLNRIRDTSTRVAAGKWPSALYREHFIAYLPLLPGEQIVELDRISLQNSDRYEVALVYTSETTGIAGYILIVEKLGV